MSFLSRSLSRAATSIRTASPVLIRARPFHVSTLQAAMSESDHSRDHLDRHSEIDFHKEDQLKKQKEGKGHWKKELASNSESAIKADRDETHNTEEDIAALQKETSEAMEDSDHKTK